jgi:putative membrane-bound dehydrogenase-like protein
MRATVFAAEPMIRQPILVKCDPSGRLWTIQYLQYPNPAGLKRVEVDRWSRTVYDRVPEPPPHGPKGADVITILEDTDRDGHADTAKNVITGLNLCTGLEFGHGGLFVLQVPYLLFYPDRDRDDVPDSDPEVLLEGFGMDDAQSLANHLTWGPDGWLYGVTGSTSTNRIRDIEFQQAVWRFHPPSRDFELFCEGGSNLFGLTFDAHGRMFFSSNGGHVCFHGVQGAYYEKSFGKHGSLHNLHAYGWFSDIRKLTPQLGGPTTGGTIYLGDTLPQLRNAFVGGDFLGHTVSWWTIAPRGSTFEINRGGTLLDPQDTWSGPTDIGFGLDGEIYVSDFYDRRTAHPAPGCRMGSLKWTDLSHHPGVARARPSDRLRGSELSRSRQGTAVNQ